MSSQSPLQDIPSYAFLPNDREILQQLCDVARAVKKWYEPPHNGAENPSLHTYSDVCWAFNHHWKEKGREDRMSAAQLFKEIQQSKECYGEVRHYHYSKAGSCGILPIV